MIRAALVAVALMLPNVASAATYAVLGVGNASCGDWTAFHSEAGEKDVLHTRMDMIEDAWLSGFISSYNDYGMAKPGDVTNKVGVNALEGWVSRYCEAHPLDSLATAAGQLIIELERRKSVL